MLISYKGSEPQIHPEAWVAPGAIVIGDVEIDKAASVWFNAVVRADFNKIKVGKNSNIQDNCTLHVDIEHSIIVMDNVIIAHGVILHGCVIEDACLIGMGSIIMNGARIGEGSVVGAGTRVPENMVVPPQSLVVGTPARIVKAIGDGMEEDIKHVYAPIYAALWKEYTILQKS